MAQERILIVDDESSIRGLLSQILERRGYHCWTASDALEARGLLAAHNFELILSDIKMPGESGLDLIRHAKRNHAYPVRTG